MVGKAFHQLPQPKGSGRSPSAVLAEDAMLSDITKMLEDACNGKLTYEQQRRYYKFLEQTDIWSLTPEQRQLVYLTAFRNILKAEGLRSPEYYRDKSQCTSFSENAPPVYKAYYKARMLSRGYVEPKELKERLKKLKRSNNFSLRRYRQPKMKWIKSSIIETHRPKQPQKPKWLLIATHDMTRLLQQGRLGERQYLAYQNEMIDYWENNGRNIELTPVPDLHFLKDMGHSPSGTLLPRYLVKGLYALRLEAESRGFNYSRDQDPGMQIKREEVIRRWQDDHPDSILLFDELSIYKTWPAELMSQLNAIDSAAIRSANEQYIADLLKTEKEMQKLYSFWKECGLVTGTRTPPSPQWLDPMAKVRDMRWPPYLREKMNANEKKFKTREEINKWDKIEVMRWKEAVLNTDGDPATSELPLTPSLSKEVEIAWRDYVGIGDLSDVEYNIITKIGQRRKKKKQQTALSGRDNISQTNADIDTEDMIDRRSPVAQGQGTSRLSRSDSIALKEASTFLGTVPRKRTRSRSGEPKSKPTWSSRLRPRATPASSSRPLPRAPRKPSKRPRGIVTPGGRKSGKKAARVAFQESSR